MKCNNCRKKIIGLRVQIIDPTTRKLLGTYCPDCADKLERPRLETQKKKAA